jgi:hypothetical protein
LYLGQHIGVAFVDWVEINEYLLAVVMKALIDSLTVAGVVE